jgi:O-antigen/teichoic acid export membrane protein
MDPLKSILRNSSVLIVAQAISTVIGMGLVVLLPRFLGDAEFGRLHLALSLTTMFGVAVEFGLTQVIARAVARQRGLTRPYLRAAAIMIAVLGVAAYVGLLFTVRLFNYHPDVRNLVVLLGMVMMAEALAQALGAIFQAHERMLVPALARVVGNAFTLAVAGPLLLRGHGAVAVALVMVVAAFLRVAIQAIAVRRLEGFQVPVPIRAAWTGLLAAGLPFLVWQALGIFYFRMDVLMLSWLTTDATVGWYGAASRLLDGLCFVPQVLTMAAFPVAARLWVTSRDEFRATVRATLNLLLVVTVPLGVALFTLARDIVGFLFTLEAFGASVPVLQVHAFTLGLLFVDFFLVGVLMAIGRERTWIAIAGAACVVSPLLSRFLIPLAAARYGNGGIGAALGTLLTEAFIMVWALRLFPAGTLGWESARVAAQAAGAGLVMGVLVVLGRAFDVPWVAAGVVGGIAYLGLVLRLGLLPPEAARWLLGLVVRRAPAEVA